MSPGVKEELFVKNLIYIIHKFKLIGRSADKNERRVRLKISCEDRQDEKQNRVSKVRTRTGIGRGYTSEKAFFGATQVQSGTDLVGAKPHGQKDKVMPPKKPFLALTSSNREPTLSAPVTNMSPFQGYNLVI